VRRTISARVPGLMMSKHIESVTKKAHIYTVVLFMTLGAGLSRCASKCNARTVQSESQNSFFVGLGVAGLTARGPLSQRVSGTRHMMPPRATAATPRVKVHYRLCCLCHYHWRLFLDHDRSIFWYICGIIRRWIVSGTGALGTFLVLTPEGLP
jgi:hypothetical protein